MREIRGWFVVAVVAMVVVVAAAIGARGAMTTPTSDTAVIETFTRLAAEGNLLLGPYSRFQWHHPGPLVFFTMAPVYWMAGAHTTGLSAAALAINCLCIAVSLWIAVRYASPLLVGTIAAAIVLLLARVPELLVSPWNAHIPVLATLALLLSAAAAATGVGASLPLVAFFGSLAGQSHVALMPLVSTVAISAAAAFATVSVRSGARSVQIAAALTRGVVTALVVWAPSLYEQVTHSPGNLGLIWRYFVSEPHGSQPFQTAVSAWADMLTGPLRPDFYLAHGWRFVESPVTWAEKVAGAEVLALAICALLASRQRRPFDAALSALLAAASALSLVAVMRIDGEIFDHAVFWLVALGALNLAAIVSGGVFALRGWRPVVTLPSITAPLASAVAMGIVVTLGAERLSASVRESYAPNEDSRAAYAVAVALRQAIAERHLVRPLIRFDQDAWGMAAGVVLQLQKHDIAVAVEDDWLAMYTPAFAATGLERAEIAIVGKAAYVRLATSGTLIASSDDRLFAQLTMR